MLFIVILIVIILIACDAFYGTEENQKKEDVFEKKLNNRQKM
ncbi:hypothetical protein CLPUN_08000 [Clostridium puniceum]|uniref:Uncharacterized protein n=1 Tax=Clostridium puniceum TaxID=29367 RepID=A0A1S8TVT5_9CLOT|nr:hypothetical protein [Clostridium puniceum]OOM81850.1 hypothetical protein CLPUN_08000 [Clostridium puniceum]